jgi:hypothetical protein
VQINHLEDVEHYQLAKQGTGDVNQDTIGVQIEFEEEG